MYNIKKQCTFTVRTVVHNVKCLDFHIITLMVGDDVNIQYMTTDLLNVHKKILPSYFMSRATFQKAG